MAKDITGKEIKGSKTTKLQAVMNQNPVTSANKFYFAARVKIDESNTNYLRSKFSEKYGNAAANDIFKEGDREITLLLTESDVLEGMYRACRNEEDIPEVSLFIDIVEDIIE